jgi:predicted DNA-binding transcriptional regulator AlpA
VTVTDLADENRPLVVDTETAAQILGTTREHLWRLVREDRAPCRVLRLGRTLRWPTADLAALVGITERPAA